VLVVNGVAVVVVTLGPAVCGATVPDVPAVRSDAGTLAGVEVALGVVVVVVVLVVV